MDCLETVGTRGSRRRRGMRRSHRIRREAPRRDGFFVVPPSCSAGRLGDSRAAAMTPWQYFPTSDPPPNHLVDLVRQFELKEDEISSERHDLNSNTVLGLLRPGLVGIGYRVESSKAAA